MIAVLLALLQAPVVAPAPSPPPDLAHYRGHLEEILSRREFRAVPRQASSEPLPEVKTPAFFKWLFERIGNALASVFEWLAKWLFRSPPREADQASSSGALSRPAVIALGLGAALLLLVVLARVFRSPRSAEATPAPAPPSLGRGAQPDALSQPAEAWARLADRFARQGEWRLALRAAFLELLVLLHERGAIRYEREKTNGEYADALRDGPAGPSFGRLVSAFDEAWYGNRPFGEPAYRAAMEWARGVDRATAHVRPAEASA